MCQSRARKKHSPTPEDTRFLLQRKEATSKEKGDETDEGSPQDTPDQQHIELAPV
jgi:hypothetical protein